jgi:hypothetical protein
MLFVNAQDSSRIGRNESLGHIAFLELVVLLFANRNLLAANLDPEPVRRRPFDTTAVLAP